MQQNHSFIVTSKRIANYIITYICREIFTFTYSFITKSWVE